MDITPEQLRAARALLRLDQADLARLSRVPVGTLRRLEGIGGRELVTTVVADHVREALEQAGAEFIPDGVRRRINRPATGSLYEDLRAISLRSAALLQEQTIVTDADLYDESGLPA